MIKPTIALAAVAALVSSPTSTLAATVPAAEAGSSSPGAHPPLAPSLRVRRAAAAGVPPHERKLLQSGATSCYWIEGGGPPTPTSCGGLSCSGATCVADEDTAKRDGSNLCAGAWAFEVANPNRVDCVWQYACC
jgi:hypothetical protein